jgi:hypothetical protein
MRRIAVVSIALTFVTVAGAGISFGQRAPAPRGELRVVDKNPANWAFITYNVMDHLVELDKEPGRRGPPTGWPSS